MKSLKNLFFLSFLAIAIISCNKDDENNSADSLIGTWKVVSETYNGEREILDECELKTIITFTETKLKSVEYDGENCDIPYEHVENYTRNGNTISIRDGSYSYTVEITKLTSSTLEITDRDDGDLFVQTFARQ